MNSSLTNCTSSSTDQKQSTQFVTPHYEISHTDDVSFVRVELPGIGKGDLQISLEDNELRLEAAISEQKPDSWKPLYRETNDGSYQLRLSLGKEVNQSAISADLVDGVLKLAFPKAEETKPRAIKVK
ncbi:Hsp20/alpha crystallin family protein [Opitutia bacterium ISCC 51]|nr:Hsp20/alpha crystallin family protein [Opitutae bacterium ISCC 51]QXD28086.1 Hsp20/alpha crystallin family protein [Opitutae bacterium ISCC 52]